MKRILSILSIAVFMAIGFASCQCNRSEQEPEQVVEAVELNVENIIATDREDMFLNYSENYMWFETCVTMENWMDEETNGEIASVSNVFEVVSEAGESYDTHVVTFTHTTDGETVAVDHGFWIEDKDMSNMEIYVTYQEAFDAAMAVNLPKPHTKNCVLRCMVGPNPCNAQYVFGNKEAQIFVDAITGEATDVNPAFNVE